jgi:uncharacterized protein with GYD domain
VYTIVDLPDNNAAAAVALYVSSSGRVKVTTTPLLTPEEIHPDAGELPVTRKLTEKSVLV